MTKEELFRAVGEVREDQVTEAEILKKANRPWRRYGTLAACLVLVLAGAFALERLEDARKWAEIEESFQAADAVHPENTPDAGSGEDEAQWGQKVVPFHPEEPPENGAGLDGESYWNSAGKHPGFNYSVNVEIGELDGGAKDDAAMDGEKNRAEVDSAACLAWLSPEEIFARDTAIFRGIVRELQYYEVDEVRLGGERMQYTAVAVEITDAIRGDLTAGEIRTVLYPGGPDRASSISGPLEWLKVDSEAVFMPETTNGETGVRNGASYFCYADLAEFYLSEGIRFVFLDTGDGLTFDRGVYEEVRDAETLDEIADYIRRMVKKTERTQPAVVSAGAQPDLVKTAPALLDPSYGVEGPNEGRDVSRGEFMVGG